LLNQRYHDEFVRAERLRADLALVERLRATWLFRLLRRLKRWLRPHPEQASPPDGDATPLDVRPNRPRGRVSIVVPFRDRGELLRDCLESLRLGSYRNFEVVLVDNGSREPGLLRLLDRLERGAGFQPADRSGRLETCPTRRVVRAPGPFNFSKLCNAG